MTTYKSNSEILAEFDENFTVNGIIPDGLPGKHLYVQDIKSFISSEIEKAKLDAFILGYIQGERWQIEWKYLKPEEQEKLLSLINK